MARCVRTVTSRDRFLGRGHDSAPIPLRTGRYAWILRAGDSQHARLVPRCTLTPGWLVQLVGCPAVVTRSSDDLEDPHVGGNCRIARFPSGQLWRRRGRHARRVGCQQRCECRRHCLRVRRRHHGRPARADLRQGHAHCLDRPGLPAAVLAQRGDRRVRGLRHRRGHRDRRPARRRYRLAGARLGHHHRRFVERPLGHERRLDDRDQRAAEVLNFTQPYYYTPAVALVHEDNDSVRI